jgi:transcriptional regulator with XRE-family HTH domain
MLPEVGPFFVKVMAFTSFTCPTYTIITKTIVDRELTDVESANSIREPAHGAPDFLARGARRLELGAFLRSRRECLSPEQDGFPTLDKRRTKGLRRHEVAKRAGIGVSWYATLEQGRVENITHKTLWAVADALRLTHRERQYIERLGFQAFDDLERLDCEVPADLLRLVQSFPDAHAHFHNANFDMLAWNADAEEFYEYSQSKNPNMLRTMARNSRLRTAFVNPNWEESLSRMLAHYRFTVASLKATEDDSIIADLVRESADFARIWRSDRSVGNPGMEAGTLDYPIAGRRHVQVLILTPTSLPTHTLVLKIRSDAVCKVPAAPR